jgi:hypothetical protein
VTLAAGIVLFFSVSLAVKRREGSAAQRKVGARLNGGPCRQLARTILGRAFVEVSMAA